VSCSKESESLSDCTNGIQDGTETAIDCGGTCPACATCNDGIKNQNETNIDCGGDCTPCLIEYPAMGIYGLNLLYGNDTLWLPGPGYSLSAIVPVGSTLKIELVLNSGGIWTNLAGSSVGWAIYSNTYGIQTYQVLNPGVVDNKIEKYSPNEFIIKFFENSAVETRRKIIIFY